MKKSDPLIAQKLLGNTPLIKLERLSQDLPFDVYGKLELLNPGGSMKDRAALSMLSGALGRGDIKVGDIVIESSSGNMGVGLAQACLRFGLHFICVTDIRANTTNITLMRALGAEVEVISSIGTYPDLLSARLARVKELLITHPGSYWTNQYSNEDNPRGYHALMSEISQALNGRVDILFCATGTCGTIRGCSDYVKTNNMQTRLIAVDAEGSVIFGGEPALRHIPGHGAAKRPKLYRKSMADDVVHINDRDAISGCYDLLNREAILAGGSSGAIITALSRCADTIPQDANVVVIIGDRGERYLDTIYCKTWLAAKKLTLPEGQ